MVGKKWNFEMRMRIRIPKSNVTFSLTALFSWSLIIADFPSNETQVAFCQTPAYNANTVSFILKDENI